MFFFLIFPLANLFFDFLKSPLNFCLINSILSFFFILVIISRLFLSWNYIKQRLNNSVIFYEESSWYDGQIWSKPKSILFQERFIYMYQVLPIIKKINTILIKTFIFFISLLILLKF